MEQSKMKIPSGALEELQKIFSNIQDGSEIADAEPRKSFPLPETGVRVIGVADEEMKVWWALAERWRTKKDSLPELPSLPPGEDAIVARHSLAQANYDSLKSIFRILAIWTFGEAIGPDDELAMYKGWIIGALTPLQSRLASLEHVGHPSHITKC